MLNDWLERVSLFFKHYLEEFTGVSFGVSTYLVVSPYHILINVDTLLTVIFNLACTAVSAAVGALVAHWVKKLLESSDKRKTNKKQ